MKRFKQIEKAHTKKDLVELLVAIGTCPSHFHAPTIVENDPDFKLGENAQVMCGQCVERLRNLFGLKIGESFPSHFQIFN